MNPALCPVIDWRALRQSPFSPVTTAPPSRSAFTIRISIVGIFVRSRRYRERSGKKRREARTPPSNAPRNAHLAFFADCSLDRSRTHDFEEWGNFCYPGEGISHVFARNSDTERGEATRAAIPFLLRFRKIHRKYVHANTLLHLSRQHFFFLFFFFSILDFCICAFFLFFVAHCLGFL